MANTDKNIVITPNNGSASDPNIVFSGANASLGPQNITLTVTPNSSGTVAFSGSAGQLLTITNDISTTLSTAGTFSATGNITANNFIGNLVGNITGNISGTLANGNSNVNIPVANGNVNISAVGNANIVVVTGTGANVTGTLSVSGNANVGNIGATNGVFTNVSGNGSSLSSITGANVTGQVGNALVAGTVYTAAQPNITSVGTLTGLTLSGNVNMGTKNITSLADPVAAQDAATKNYVDTTAQGLDPKASVVYATTTTLFGSGYTYNNGTSGVGATLTSSTNGAISIDGSTPTAGDRVLIKNEAGAFVNNTTQSAAFNGIYIVTQVGSGALPFILTRAVDFDVAAEMASAFTFVEAGTINSDTGWVCTTNNPITVGTTSIAFVQFSGAGTYSAGTGLTLTGTVFSVNASQTQVTAVGTLTSLSVSGNANVGNIGAANGVFTNVSGNGSSLSSITGANVTGQVGNALVAGTVYTNAQPNITSVGTLTSLSATGNVTGNYIIGNGSALTGIAAGNITGQVANALVAGTVYTNAQPNITSVGTLTTLSVSGNANVGNLSVTGYANINGATIISGNTGLPVATGSNPIITGGLGTPNIGKLYIGDGTGWNFKLATRLASTDTDRVTFYDNGNVAFTGALTGITTVSSTGNITTTGNISATGNITANNISIGNVETVGVFTRYSKVTFLDNTNVVAGNRLIVTMPAPAAVSGMYSGVLKVYATRQFDNSGGPRSHTTFKLSRVGNISGANATFYVNEAVVDKTSAFAYQWYFDSTTGTPTLVIGQNSNSYNWYVESELDTATIPTITIGSNAGSYGTAYYPLYTLATPGTDSGGLTVTASNSSNTMVFDSNGQLSLAGNITAGNLIGPLANGNSNVNIPAANGNVNITAVGNTTLVVTGTGANITGTLNISGNTIGANIQALTFKTSGTAISPAYLQSATVNAAAGTAYGFLSRGTLAAQANSDMLLGYDVSLGTANTGTTGLTGLTFYGGRFDGASWSSTGNGTINNAYSVYASTPTIGTNNYAIFASGVISATGNITGGNLTTGGLISATGNITGNYFIGNGSALTGIAGANVTGQVANALVAGTVYTNAQPNITSVGTLTSLSVAGNANVDNIGGARGIFTTTVNTPLIQSGTSNITLASGGNISTIIGGNSTAQLVVTPTGANIPGTLSVTGNITGGNLTTGGLISATGNITGNYILGNGSQLTGITSSGSATNAAAVQTNTSTSTTVYLAGVTSSANGNSALNIVTGITANMSNNAITATTFVGALSGAATTAGTVTTNAQPNITSVGILTLLSVAGNANVGNVYTGGLISATGNITGNYIIGNGSALTGIAGANVTGQVGNALVAGTVYTNAQPNITSVGTLTSLSVAGNANVGNVYTGGLISATGNITGGNLITGGLLSVTGAVTASSYTASNSLAGYTLANSGTQVGKIFENGNIIKLEATPATYGVALAANGTVMLSFDANGYGAVGASAGTTGYALRIAKNTTGNTTAGSILINPTIQNDVTSLASGIRISLSAAANNTGTTIITNLAGSATYGGTYGANISVTNQFAYYVDSSFATANTTNIYGLYTGYNEASGRWGIYLSGSAQNYINGTLGIGSTSVGLTSGINFRSSRVLSGNVASYGVLSDGQIQSDVTSAAILYRSTAQTQATAFTLADIVHYQAVQGTFGAGSTVTTQTGFSVGTSLIGATNNYGFRSTLQSGTGRYGLYLEGTANNYINGSLGLGTTSLTGYSVRDVLPITGAVVSYGHQEAGTVQSDVTTSASYNQTYAQTAAAAFTLPNLYHFQATQGTFGAGSTVTTQQGFVVDSTLIGATNNYGFRGSIAAGTGRYNLYIDGSANNYIAGNFGIGNNAPTTNLAVTGTAYISGNANIGNIGTAQVLASANITAPQLISNVTTGTAPLIVTSTTQVANLSVATAGTATSATTAGTVTTNAQPNITSVGTLTSLSVSGNANVGNLGTAGLITATGNVTGNYFIGNGSQLTGISSTSLANGTSNVSIPVASGNINLSSAGNANVLVITGTGANIAGTISASGNANVANLTVGAGTGGNITGANVIASNTFLANGANGTVVANNFTASGNATGNANVSTITGNLGIRAIFSTYTDSSAAASATIANAAIHAIAAPNLAAANATVTFTNAATFYIAGAPVANTNATITNPYALFVASGNSYFAGNVTFAGNLLGSLANGNSNVSIPAANGNVNISAVGVANILVVTGTGANIAGTLSASGNANAGNIGAAQGIFTTSANIPIVQNGNSNVSIVASANINFGVTGVANVVSIVPNGLVANNTITANNLTIAGATSGQPNVLVTNSNIGIRTVAATYTDTAATGTQANAAIHYVATPTITGGSNAKTYTNMATLFVAGAPTAGTNATITNNYALFVGGGNSFFAGNIIGTFANGNSNVNIPAANGNVNISAVGNANILIITGTGANVTGTLNATGNANVGNLGVTGVFATTLSATGNANVGNLGVGIITASGNVTVGNLSITGVANNPTITNYTETLQAVGTVGASATLSLTTGTVITATLTASTPCTFTMPTATAGKSFVLKLVQAATGMTTATFTGVKWPGGTAPTITATASAVDIISFLADGSNWYGSYTQAFA